METNDILTKFNESLEKVLVMQSTQQTRKFEWVKIAFSIAPFILLSAFSIIVSFTKLENKIENSRQDQIDMINRIEQVKRDENKRATTVDYNFELIEKKHPDLIFMPTVDVK